VIIRREETTPTGSRSVWLSIDHGFQSKHGRVGSIAVATHRTRDEAGQPIDAWYLVVGFARDGELYRGWRERAWFPTQAEAEAEARRLFAEHAVLAAQSARRAGSTFEPSR
jgi:hypothetical protein